MNQHYHPLRDTTTTSPIITDSTSSYYTHHHRAAVSLFSPTTNMNLTPASSSSPFKPTATLSPYSSPSTIVCRLSFVLLLFSSLINYLYI